MGSFSKGRKRVADGASRPRWRLKRGTDPVSWKMAADPVPFAGRRNPEEFRDASIGNPLILRGSACILLLSHLMSLCESIILGATE